ncbi:MAG TPA: GlxA family transcriptional regulator [Alphaproteobacteria bacterium]|nr:GlxA family transcriptional regulator [Alphaproteobacteria bacterium]
MAGPAAPRLVVLVAFDDVQHLDVSGPADVFSQAEELAAAAGAPGRYRIALVSPGGGAVRTSSGLMLLTEGLAAFSGRRDRIDTLIVAGGGGVDRIAADGAAIGLLRALAGRARRVCSVCTGAFALAAMGVLDGRRAATHWRHCDRLRSCHPNVRVEAEPIFIRDGDVWTSAGVTAGIDLALALVADDLGRAVAMEAARRLVVFLKRPGDQAQFSAPLSVQLATAARGADGRLAALQAWMAEHLAEDLRVERLAEQAGMSARTFARAFARQVGLTPARAVELMRLEAARRALEEGAADIKQVAAQTGFGDEERMRRAFIRQLGVPPTDYRRRFSA